MMKKLWVVLATLMLFSLTFTQPGRYVRTDVANTYSSGAKQSFQHSATTAGFKLLSFVGDPTSLENGDMWYNSTLNKFRKYEAGAISDIGSGGGGGGDSGSVNATGVADFNLGTLPAAAADGLNVVWQLDAAATPDNVSAYILMTSITKVGTLTAGVWNGTAVDAAYLDTNVVLDDSSNTYTSGAKQLFGHSATTAGFNLVPTTGDPSGPANGDIWYNSTDRKFRKHEDGLTSDLTTVGAAPGADTNVIYNDAGVLGAESDLAWNETTNILTSTGGFQTGGTAAGQVQITEATATGSNKAIFTVGDLSADYTLTFPSIGSGGVFHTTSGGAVTFSDVALTTSTSGNYVANANTGIGLTGGTAGSEGAALTLALKYTDTLAANPSLGVDECVFSSDGTGGVILCEGNTADTIEGLIVWPVTTSDRTVTIPDATTTLVGTGTTDSLTNKTLDGGDSGAGTARTSGGNIMQIVSHNTDCTSLTGFKRGELCYEEDANTLYACEPTAGDCDTAGEWINASAAGAGDVTDVFGCATGDCATITIATAEYLDGGTATVDGTAEGILLPRGTSCAAAVDEGHICWDTDNDTLWVGDGAAASQIGVGSGDITDVFGCATGDCTSITIATGELLDGGTATVDAIGEGMRAPRGASCTAAVDEGQLCWDTDDDDLYIGNGATVTQINTASAVTTKLYFRPNQNQPPAAAFATLDTRNSHPVLDFDPASDECALFTGILTGYASGGLNVELVFACATEIDASEDIYWETSFEYIDDSTLDIDADSFAAASSCSATCSTTSGVAVTATCAHTDVEQIDSLATGKPFRIKVCRDADNASDDADDDGELLTVYVSEP